METVARLLTRHELWKTLKMQRTDRQIEALAVIFGLKRFHLYLYGHHFKILMDHEPLERIFGPQDSYSLTGSHGSSTLGHGTVSIQLQHYRFLSKQNAVADVLSRLPLPSTVNGEDAIYRMEERLVHSLPITHKEISYATRVDPVLSRASEFVKQGWSRDVEDLRLHHFSLNRWFELSVEQDCAWITLFYLFNASSSLRHLDQISSSEAMKVTLALKHG